MMYSYNDSSVFLYFLTPLLTLFKDRLLSQIVAHFSHLDWLHAYWDMNIWNLERVNIGGNLTPSTGPCLIPLWFLRDLMVVVIITPLVYGLLKQFKIYGLALLAVCYITGVWPNIPGFSILAVFFFSLGAYFSIHQRNIVEDFSRFKWGVYILYPVLLVPMVFFDGRNQGPVILVCPFFLIVSVLVVFNLCPSLLKKRVKITHPFLAKTSFFIYVAHGFLGVSCASLLLGLLIPSNDNWMIQTLRYLITPIVTIAICGLVYWGLSKVGPRTLGILTGSRK